MTKKTKSKQVKKRRSSSPQQSGIEVIVDGLVRLMGKMGKGLFFSLLAVVLVVVLAGYYIIYKATDMSASVDVDQRIGITPTQIASMKQIGEWEFLSVADEELIDTLRAGFFKDDELIRIYYGTLRLGIDMREMGDDWLEHDDDTLVVKLPPVKLLDEQFIDEARTLSFFESGKWTDADRHAMYERARERMKARALNSSNLKSAEENATWQFYQLLRSMGFDKVRVRLRDDQPKD